MVEDKLRFIEDVAENTLETPIYYPNDDGTTLKPIETQDNIGIVQASNNVTGMEAEVMSPKEDISTVDPTYSLDVVSSTDTNRRRSENKIFAEADKSLNHEPNLPDNESSNYENVSLDPKDSVKNLTDSSTEKIDENAEKVPDSNVANTEMIKCFVNFSLAVENEKLSEDVERTSNGEDNSRQCETLSGNLSLQDNPWENMRENCEEASIEDSCEKQLTFGHSKSVDTLSDTSQTVTANNNNSMKRSSTLSEDSRLVKISLPTSSMNIMQSNAQFLNKSRNFLNFITEKSTNIMEKTLLPQNIAVRYNSFLKPSDGGYAPEKKHSDSILDESSNVKSPITSNDEETIDVNNKKPEDSQNDENLSGIEANVFNEFSKKLDSSAGINDFGSPKDNVLLIADNNVDNVLYKSHEETAESRPEKINQESRKRLENDSSELENKSEDPLNGLLNNPVYLTLVGDYAKAREDKLKLADRVKYLEEKNRMLEDQNCDELFTVKLETLEKTVERLTGELRLANANQEELGRVYAAANKERESMVMKYAVSEKQLIDTQRARDHAERRFKEIAKDHELLQNKLRQAQNERTRICSIMDIKCRELTEAQKEVERLKEDVNVRDAKLTWTQTKLKEKMEAQKETQQKLDKAMTRINDMKEECEQVRRESQEMIWKFQHSEENKAVTLDQQLKEQQARLILERHVTEDKEMLRIQLQKEVDLLKNRQQALIEENNMLSLKIQDLEKDRLAYESKLSELKIVADQRQKEIVDLSAKVSHLETLKLQLIHKEQCLASNEAEVERLRRVNQELQADMDCCRQREAHMLDFTQKLTDKNVRLQSEFTAVEAKAAQLEREQGPLREGIAELRTKTKTLEANLAHEKTKRMEECEILARHLAEQTQLAQNLSQKLEDSQGEIAVLRRKQQISVKEMSRELQQCRKRLEAYENASPSSSLDPTSRAGSNTSLNTGETLNGIASDHSGNGEHTIQSTELDRQSLIDRILKMQKINVRRAEKLDFLEEHTRTLVAEIQKKTKIIQNYILHENFDAMGSNERDRHKAELARHGGIMASVYNHRVSDDNMTLELSLEINQKLQAVLEDALLKNITLKDNIDTLGEEIARLTIKNQQLLQQKPK